MARPKKVTPKTVVEKKEVAPVATPKEPVAPVKAEVVVKTSPLLSEEDEDFLSGECDVLLEAIYRESNRVPVRQLIQRLRSLHSDLVKTSKDARHSQG